MSCYLQMHCSEELTGKYIIVLFCWLKFCVKPWVFFQDGRYHSLDTNSRLSRYKDEMYFSMRT